MGLPYAVPAFFLQTGKEVLEARIKRVLQIEVRFVLSFIAFATKYYVICFVSKIKKKTQDNQFADVQIISR